MRLSAKDAAPGKPSRDRIQMSQFDPELPFEMGPVNEREMRESELYIKRRLRRRAYVLATREFLK